MFCFGVCFGVCFDFVACCYLMVLVGCWLLVACCEFGLVNNVVL